MIVKSKGFLAGAAVGAVGAAAAAALAAAELSPQSSNRAAPEEARLIRTQNLAPVFAPPPGAPLSFADIVQRVSPAVVSLEVRGRAPGRSINIPGFGNFPFNIVPRDPDAAPTNPDGRPGDDDGDRNPETQASGSGFFISADGYIVTNNHVVENAREITVTLSDQRELTARVVGRDEDTDLAVLKVEGRNFPYVSFATNATPRVGDWVIAVGNPFQLGNTATAGIVSAYGRDIGDTFVDYLQIDAPINRGNSGGPTFDIYGRVIGVNTAIFSQTGGSVGIGFAIPAELADQITRQLISGGKITRGYLGVGISNVTREIAETQGLREARGALVGEVTPGGPSARAGLQEGDIVLRVNGEAIQDANDLTRRVAAAREGQTIRLEVLRGNQTRTFNVVSGTRPTQAELDARQRGEQGGGAAPSAPAQPRGPVVLGMNIAALDEASRRAYGVGATVRGVVVERVAPETDASDKGLRRGDVIFRINDRDVATPADVQAAVEAARRLNRTAVLVWVNRNGQTAPVPIRLQPRSG
ncbi:MAG TPA: Do family serine endopeptidase [Caulobacteraceae bacterium]